MPLSIQHFPNKGLSWRNLYLGAPDIAVARDKIVFNLGEHTREHLDDAAAPRPGLRTWLRAYDRAIRSLRPSIE